MGEHRKKILAIGAHPDDIEIGCGGTIAAHVLAGHDVRMLVVTNGSAGPGDTALRVKEQDAAKKVLGVQRLYWGDLPDGSISLHELDAVHLIERIVNHMGGVDVVYTHTMKDTHQDHRAIAEFSMGGARSVPTILTYDAPSSLNFNPIVTSDVSKTLNLKLEALKCHASQVKASKMVDLKVVKMRAEVLGFDRKLFRPAEGFEPIRMVNCI